MLRLIQTVFFCVVLLVSGCSTSASRTEVQPGTDDLVAASDAAPEAPATVVDDDPLVCKNVVTTGSRVAQRTCRRQSEIDADKRDAQEMLGEVQKRGAISTESVQ